MKYFMKFIYFIFSLSLFWTGIAFSVGIDFDGAEVTNFGKVLKRQTNYSPVGCTLVGKIDNIKEIEVKPKEKLQYGIYDGYSYYEVAVNVSRKYSIQNFGSSCSSRFDEPVVLNIRGDRIIELDWKVGDSIKVASMVTMHHSGKSDEFLAYGVREVGPWHKEVLGNIARFIISISAIYMFGGIFLALPILLITFLIIVIRLIVLKKDEIIKIRGILPNLFFIIFLKKGSNIVL